MKLFYSNTVRFFFSTLCLLSAGTPYSHAIVPCDSLPILLAIPGTDSSQHVGFSISGIGNINNDQFDDIGYSMIVDGGLVTRIVLGGSPIDTNTYMTIKGSVVNSRPYDYDGDGIPDVLTKDNGRLLLFKGKANGLDSLPSDSLGENGGLFQISNWIAYPSTISNTDVADIIVWNNNGPPGSRIFHFETPFFSDKVPDWIYVDDSQNVRRVQVGDISGDNLTDILLQMKILNDSTIEKQGSFHAFIGPGFPMTPNFSIQCCPTYSADSIVNRIARRDFATSIWQVGDMNGDGSQDLALSGVEGTSFLTSFVVFYTYFGGMVLDTVLDFSLDNYASTVLSVGDLNGDSASDLLIGNGLAMDGGVGVYLGGRIGDGTMDYCVNEFGLPPWFLTSIGEDLADAGDVNGDGFSDIFLNADNFLGGYSGAVFVLAGGTHIKTDVDESDNPVVPATFHVSHPYPNPFNSTVSTVIELPNPGEVTVQIYNVLGEIVWKSEKTFSESGRHIVRWEESKSGTRTAPSGIYFLTITFENQTFSRKLVFLK